MYIYIIGERLAMLPNTTYHNFADNHVYLVLGQYFLFNGGTVGMLKNRANQQAHTHKIQFKII